MKDQLKSIAINGSVIILVSLLLLFCTTMWRMNRQFNQGEDAFNRRDFTAAVAGYESALHMYIPGHPIIGKSADKLWQLGEISERQGDINRALIAYRALRSSFYADHWLMTPGIPWIEKCDRKIAALVPLQQER